MITTIDADIFVNYGGKIYDFVFQLELTAPVKMPPFPPPPLTPPLLTSELILKNETSKRWITIANYFDCFSKINVFQLYLSNRTSSSVIKFKNNTL